MFSSIRSKERPGASGAAVLLFAALTLAGCGGGGGGEAAVPAAAVADAQAVPPGAAVSVQALLDFQQGLAVSNDTEPLKTSGFLPPDSDTAEPMPLR